MIGHKQPLTKMLGHKSPLGVHQLGHKSPLGAMAKSEVLAREMEGGQKKGGGLERAKRGAGYNQGGQYSG